MHQFWTLGESQADTKKTPDKKTSDITYRGTNTADFSWKTTE